MGCAGIRPQPAWRVSVVRAEPVRPVPGAVREDGAADEEYGVEVRELPCPAGERDDPVPGGVVEDDTPEQVARCAMETQALAQHHDCVVEPVVVDGVIARAARVLASILGLTVARARRRFSSCSARARPGSTSPAAPGDEQHRVVVSEPPERLRALVEELLPRRENRRLAPLARPPEARTGLGASPAARPRDRSEEREPTRGLEPRTPSLRVKCSTS